MKETIHCEIEEFLVLERKRKLQEAVWHVEHGGARRKSPEEGQRWLEKRRELKRLIKQGADRR